jgi:3-oxoacyl-[acyl-carrier protein] reductase
LKAQMMNRSVAGRVALVTGAGSGIGRATALALANEGAAVGVLDLQLDAALETASSHSASMLGVACDVTSISEVDCALASLRSAFGPIDIVVNNAGVSIPTPISDPGFEAGWQRSIDVNLTAQTVIIRACLDDLIRNRDGRIVNVASTEGLGGSANISAYAASKHGVIGLTRSLSVELGRFGVTVNAVCPGPINTAMTERIPSADKETFARRRTALRRYGEPAEVADIILSMVLPSASYLTGSVIAVDGGMTARNM